MARPPTPYTGKGRGSAPSSKANLVKFEMGVSGNPGGRSKVVQSALQYARSKSKEALITLWCIACDDTTKPQDRIRAIEIMLDRGMGKPAQMNLNLNAEGALSQNEIGLIAREVVRSIEGVEGAPNLLGDGVDETFDVDMGI